MIPEARQSLAPMNGSQREGGGDPRWSPALPAAAGAVADYRFAGALGQPAAHGEAVSLRGAIPHAVLVVLEVDHVPEVLIDCVGRGLRFEATHAFAEPVENFTDGLVGAIEPVVP